MTVHFISFQHLIYFNNEDLLYESFCRIIDRLLISQHQTRSRQHLKQLTLHESQPRSRQHLRPLTLHACQTRSRQQNDTFELATETCSSKTLPQQ